jgi:hypothetical protein
MKRRCKRTFNGIQFTHVEQGLWRSDDGIELMKACILTYWDKWSVEHNPREGVSDSQPHGRRATGFTAVEALENAGLRGAR